MESHANIREFVASHNAEELVTEILSFDRVRPIVMLTSRKREERTALDPEGVVTACQGDIDLWLVRDQGLTFQLRELFTGESDRFEDPENRNPCPFLGAAGVWWPADRKHGLVRRELVVDRNGNYGEHHQRKLEEIVRSLGIKPRSGFDAVRDELKAVCQERDEEVARRQKSEAKVKEYKGKFAEECRLRRRAEQANRQLNARRNEAVCERSFKSDVAGHWADNICAPGRELRPFTLAPGFEESLRSCEVVDREATIRVVAKLVGGLKVSVSPRPFRKNRGANAEARLDDEGNPQSRVNLKTNSRAAARMIYSQRPDGMIKLISVGTHDDHIR